MTAGRYDASFTVDLRDRRGRRRAVPPQDAWTANASPWDHRMMVERHGERGAWEDHLTRCRNCRRAQAIADIVDFAVSLGFGRTGAA